LGSTPFVKKVSFSVSLLCVLLVFVGEHSKPLPFFRPLKNKREGEREREREREREKRERERERERFFVFLNNERECVYVYVVCVRHFEVEFADLNET
jgi:hypothetical protein